jgi:diacylglycerol kinase (ATP)
MKRPIQALLRHWLSALRCSLDGLAAVWRGERAFREEVVVLAIAVPLALALTGEPLERAALIGSWALVLVIEVLNSAIEAVVDRIGPQRHELSRKAKDAGSAAVLLAIALAASVWLAVLVPKLAG